MKIKIYKQDNTVLKEVTVLDNSVISNEIRGEHTLSLSFSSAEYVDIPDGAYVVVGGTTYTMMSQNRITQDSQRSNEVTAVFEAGQAMLSSIRMRNPDDGTLSFPYTATAEDHLALIIANLNRYGDGNEWSIGDCIDDNTVRYLQYDYVSCLDALNSIADIFGTEWEIIGTTISLHKVEYNISSPLELAYGKDNGLRPGTVRETIERPMTRLYPQGGSRNIDTAQYGSPILLLPESITFKYDGNKFEDEAGFDNDNARTYTTDTAGTYVSSVRNASRMANEGVIDCTDIYPSATHSVIGFEYGSTVPSWVILDVPENLDYSQHVILGELPSITFQSGNLQGRTFEIRRNQDGSLSSMKEYSESGTFVGWRFMIASVIEDGVMLPDQQSGMVPENGDTCRIFGVQLPAEYVCDNVNKSGASWDMLRRCIMYLYECEDYIYSLKVEVDPIWARKNWAFAVQKFRIGGYISYVNDNWAQDGMMMRIQSIRQGVSNPYSIEIELGNGIVGGDILKGLADKISRQAGSLSEQENISKSIEYNLSSIDTSDFVTLSTEQTITAKKTFAEDVIFGAANADGSYARMFVPSTAGEGVYDMYISDTPVQGEVPSSSSGIDEEELWAILGNAGIQKISKTHLPSDTVYTGAMNAAIQSALSPYATRTWVQQQGYITAAALDGYATRAWVQEQGYVTGQYLGTVLSGYYTAEETDELLADYVTLATAQTVTGAKTFAASLTKFNAVSGTNADLSGYISAARLYVPSSAGGKVYDLYVSDGAVSGEVPSGNSGIDEAELWSILGNTGTQQIGASHLSTALAPYATQSWVQQQNYATQSWVEGKGYITSSALTPYATKEWVQGLGYLTSVSLATISDLHSSWDAVLKAQKPAWLTTVSLSTISDLHSSWDALLKAAPSAYVTRWPSFAEVTSRPTTLSGYGITDAYTKSEIAGLLAGYVTLATAQTVTGKKTFSALLTASGGISGTNADFNGYVSAVKLYVPSGSGNKVYDLYISDTAVSGEAPSGSSGIDEAELWTILTDGEGGEVIDISHIPAIPADSVTGLLGTDGRISASLLPDFLLGQLLYGGTIGASSVATLSAAFKDRYNVSASTLTVTASNAAAYEGVYFIASANGTSGIVSSLGVRTGDWVVSSGISWNKIDNTDSVSSVAGLTGVISRQSLQSALSDSAHRFVTDAQIGAWNAKWDWDEADIRAVKVNSALRADGLSTPRTIAISGGVTGTATAFSGTSDISIPVTSVKEAYLSWGGRDIAGGVSPVDAAMVDTLGANRFAFMKPSAITVEYSRNGGQTWTAYPFSDTQKVALFSGIVTPCYIGASPEEGVDKSAYQLRITIDTSKAPLYTELKKIVIDCSSSGSTGCWCTVEGRTHGDVEGGVNEWAVFVNRAAIAGWSGYSVINTSLTTYGNSDAHYQQVRLTFGVTEHSAASAYPGLSIHRIMGYGGFGWETPSAMAASGHLYSYDASGNAEFPAAVEADAFIGPLSGNASSATKLATARTLWGRPFDGTGNVSGAISSTGNITPSAAHSGIFRQRRHRHHLPGL